MDKEIIVLTKLNGTGYVFDVDDYMRLRQQHRIVGALVGTSSNKGWSINEFTMPVELSPLETRLLIEEGIAILVSKTNSLLADRTPAEIACCQEEMEARLEAQKDTLRAEKMRETDRNIDKVLAGKRKKLLRLGVAESDIKLDKATMLQQINDSLVYDRKHALVDIPCAHPQKHIGQIVSMPADTSLKYRVFCDFWRRGKYVTDGDSFGADFLVYPGDPMLYHASHLVIVLTDPELSPLDLITFVRLAVAVNKVCMFAFEKPAKTDGEVPELCYQSLQWLSDKEKRTRNELNDPEGDALSVLTSSATEETNSNMEIL